VLGTVQLAFADPRFLPGMSLLIDERTSVMNPSGTEKRERVKSLASLRPVARPAQ